MGSLPEWLGLWATDEGTYPPENIPDLGLLEKIPAFISQHIPGKHTTLLPLLCYLSPQSSGKPNAAGAGGVRRGVQKFLNTGLLTCFPFNPYHQPTNPHFFH